MGFGINGGRSALEKAQLTALVSRLKEKQSHFPTARQPVSEKDRFLPGNRWVGASRGKMDQQCAHAAGGSVGLFHQGLHRGPQTRETRKSAWLGLLKCRADVKVTPLQREFPGRSSAEGATRMREESPDSAGHRRRQHLSAARRGLEQQRRVGLRIG